MNPDTNSGQFWNVVFVWGAAALGAVLACVMLYRFADMGISGAVFLAALLFFVAGFVLHRGMLTELPPPVRQGAAPSAPAPAVAAAPEVAEAPAPEPALAPEPAPAPAPEPIVAAEDGKPAGLTEARGGTPDDLKKIKGVGPKLEKLLHSMGFYHFDQIAGWTVAEIAWVDANLEGFKGRVTRDTWVDQAKALAAGEDTAFSKKVDKGGVY